jgi:Trypsin-like peptidase domain
MTKSPFHNVKGDVFSFCVTPVELLIDKTHFAHGTGFILKHTHAFHLVTAWHNLSGQNPLTGRHLNDGGRVPNTIRIMPCTFTEKGDQTEIRRHPIEVSLYEHFDQPFWWQHKDFVTNRADIAILRLPTTDLVYRHVNQYQFEPLFTHIGADLLIAGYPYSSYEGLLLPIWKRGSLASEPGFGWQNRPAFLIDAASRPGMSGSPVFRRVFGPAASPDGQGGYTIKGDNVMTSEFLGVYADHLTAQDANVTIGYAWYGALIDEILADPAAGTRL